MMGPKYKNVGFIGLGAMGKHMAEHLANKLPKESTLYVYDVIPDAVKELTDKYPSRVTACESAKQVAENSVYNPIQNDKHPP